MSEAGQVTVHVKYGNVEQMFAGNANDVWISINKFFSEMIPAFDIVRKVTLTVDLTKLIEDFKNVIAIAPEGPEVLIPKEKLTDSETLQLYLLAAYIGYHVGKLPHETMTKEELQTKLGKNMKITTTRLGELVKGGFVAKTDEGKYKLTTIGIKKFAEEFDLSFSSRCSRENGSKPTEG